jgi:hypothetical protein
MANINGKEPLHSTARRGAHSIRMRAVSGAKALPIDSGGAVQYPSSKNDELEMRRALKTELFGEKGRAFWGFQPVEG